MTIYYVPGTAVLSHPLGAGEMATSRSILTNMNVPVTAILFPKLKDCEMAICSSSSSSSSSSSMTSHYFSGAAILSGPLEAGEMALWDSYSLLFIGNRRDSHSEEQLTSLLSSGAAILSRPLEFFWRSILTRIIIPFAANLSCPLED